MKTGGTIFGILVGLTCLFALTGCEKSSTSSPPTAGAPPATPPGSGAEKKEQPAPPVKEAAPAPANKEPAPAAPKETGPAGSAPTASVDRSATMLGKPLKLTGLTLVIPEGWIQEEVPPGPMAAVAAFKLPKIEGDQADAVVRVTHYPNMKGKDDMNIERWLAQVQQPNGMPYTKTGANINTKTVGNIRMTVLDLSGSVKATMSADAQPNSRMIATILDHPQGPHFVVSTGEAATMARWEGSISGFLRSASTN